MAKRKKASTRRPGTLVVMSGTNFPQRVCNTAEAAAILGVHVRYVRRLASQGEIWSAAPFGQRAPVYNADQLEARAALAAKERAAGVRKGRPPAAVSG
jgi:excisionase family DNA binding protein